ncbi:MAG: mechanosensitive ion channel family protein [Spirochaetaceae bacterium]|jgi:small conductance mechanosensitive channel|nr:mechanosensitive ion channel family protein [Spirochaetaceae bacterium]
MSEVILNFLSDNKSDFLLAGRKLFIAVIIVVAGIVIYNIFKKLINHVDSNKKRIDDALLSLLRVAMKYALVIVCLIMLLDVFGVNVTGLVALLGTAGVAIGLALKDTLGNIAAGIVLLVLKSYRKGDFIEFDGFMGTIKEFDLFTTKLETPDGVLISAPNSSIWKNPIKNYSQNSKRRMDLVIGISYEDSIDAAYRVMREIVEAEPRFLLEPAPQIVVQSLNDSSVNILLRAWASSDVYWDVYWKHMRLIKEKIEAAGLSIPYPNRTVHLVK